MPDAKLWCPGCKVDVDVAEATVAFTPVSARLQPDGTFSWGMSNDTFYDYCHMLCGTLVRIVSNAHWNEEMGEYVTEADPAIEVTIDGEYVQPEDWRKMFSADLSDDPQRWGPTYVVLMDMLAEAKKTFKLVEET